MKLNKPITLEKFYEEINLEQSEEKQKERINSYLGFVKENIEGNILEGKKTLHMGNAFGFLDITTEQDYLQKQHGNLAKDLKLNMNVYYEIGDIRYEW